MSLSIDYSYFVQFINYFVSSSGVLSGVLQEVVASFNWRTMQQIMYNNCITNHKYPNQKCSNKKKWSVNNRVTVELRERGRKF